FMEGRILERYRHPVLFYLLSTLIPWVMWFMAGYVSHIEPSNYFYLIIQSNLGILGLVSPVLISFIFIYLAHTFLMYLQDSFLYLIIQSILFIFGLFSSVIIAFILIYPDPVLRRDLKDRMFNLKEITPFYLMVTCFVMLASILLAQAISLLFGYSITQFSFSE